MLGISTGKLYLYIIGTLFSLLAISGLVYYINSLNDEIALQQQKIETLKSDIDTNNVILLNKENLISEKISENKMLLDTIDKYNNIIEVKEKALTKSKKDLNKWKALTESEKFKYTNALLEVDKINYDKATCEQGLKLMHKISELDFNNMYKIKVN